MPSPPQRCSAAPLRSCPTTLSKGSSSTSAPPPRGAWLDGLLKHENYDLRAAALRILETREKYATDAFKYDVMKDLACKSMAKGNEELKKSYMMGLMSIDDDEVGEEEKGEAQGAEGAEGAEGDDAASE